MYSLFKPSIIDVTEDSDAFLDGFEENQFAEGVDCTVGVPFASLSFDFKERLFFAINASKPSMDGGLRL